MSLISRAYAIRPGESLWPRNPQPGADVQLLVGEEQSEGAYALVHYNCLEPIYPHIHDRDDESVYVIRGEPTVTIGDVDHPLKPGSFIYMPKGVPHAISSDQPWEGLSISTPGGVFDRMMEEIGEAVVGGTELDPNQMGQIMAKHGIRVLDEAGRWYGEEAIPQ